MTVEPSAEHPGQLDPSRSCFVVMPFHDPFDRYYARVFTPAIAAAGLIPLRGDSIFRAGDVVRQLAQAILAADVVLAELSMLNANVYYELGLAHALLKPTVLVTQNVDVVPFDLRGGRVIRYERDDPFWGEVLKSNITRALLETMRDPGESLPVGLSSAILESRAAADRGGTASDSVPDFYRVIEEQLRQMQRSIELTTRPSGLTSIQPGVLAQAESARETIRLLFQNGTGREEILKQLTALGVSQLWAEDAIEEISRELNT